MAKKDEAQDGLVKMVKLDDQGNVVATADVHPDEVENYKTGDWRTE